MKMVFLQKSKLLFIILFSFFWYSELNSYFQNITQLEIQIQSVLKRIYPKNPITVKAVANSSNPADLKTLSIKIENIREGLFSIDIFTIIFQNPKIDFIALKQNSLRIRSVNLIKLMYFMFQML